MKTILYNRPSTFTYLGRHASELKFLLSRAKSKNEILDIGPGPFEPFYIAALSPESKVTVIDNSQKILNKIKSIRSGVLLPIKEAASICFNTNDNGTMRQNNDLLDERLILKGIEEMKIAGLSRSLFMYDRIGFFGYHGNGEIVVMEQMDITSVKPWKKFDVVFDGLVLLNLRKTQKNEDFDKAVQTILDLTQDNGMLGISTTPEGISGKKEYLSLILKAAGSRLHLQELILDNFVNSDGGIRGGYLSIFTKDSDSPVNPQSIYDLFSNDPLLARATFFKTYLDETRLLDFLHANGFLLLYAIHAGGDYYNACFAKMDTFDIPAERHHFQVMAELAHAK